MKKIYVTRKLPGVIMDRLHENFDVNYWDDEDEPVPRDVLLREMKECEGLFCMLTETIDEELLDAAPKLKIVANLAVGYNNIDIEAAKNRNVIVTNTPGVLSETTADLTFALMLASARRLVETSEVVRNGTWGAWSPMHYTGQDVHGKTLGIIGLGRIGEAVAKRSTGFDMNVLYHNRRRNEEAESRLGVTYVSFNELLKHSDFIVLLLPYSKSNHHLIGSQEIGLMKKEAILINTARGGLVDEGALYHALEKREIYGAGLDVFEEEPVPLTNPLLQSKYVTTSPHIGSASIETRLHMCHLVTDNLIHVLSGRDPLTPVTK
ncbi:2-hydroxyacid dehydrogenase [Geomicrobium sediminis]|uniref:Glyoxylate reductase n=1 Tax=Geomicrobium sediminis TaxID=1347788 RepID=A0ABS2PHU2_9BACL|nr:D-glycerate dehydrogenase [Geomicrobium sediminis]MBM7635004.1 glyoxylate reductase [Geomicrobium sediminis]